MNAHTDNPIAVGVVDRGKHAAFRLHGAEMLTDNFQVTVAEKPAINRGAGCELADKFAWLLPRHTPLAKRWLPLVVLGHSDALRVVGPAITSD
jgi:hypothetical protein